MREAKEAAAIKAALDLFGATGAAGFMLPIPNTRPPLYLVCGEVAHIARLVQPNRKGKENASREPDPDVPSECTQQEKP